jgi:ATP-dependent DNA helicase PIF1
VFLPRIELTPTSESLPFKFKRIKYLVLPCYAITNNKAQGQTYNHVGVCLNTPVFSHGQLYVGCSRVTRKSGLKIQYAESASQGHIAKGSSSVFIKNVVYQNVLITPY